MALNFLPLVSYVLISTFTPGPSNISSASLSVQQGYKNSLRFQGGLALGVGIAIVYWAASALTEAMGAVGQLPPFLAGWAPDTIFGFLGLYFFLKMPT